MARRSSALGFLGLTSALAACNAVFGVEELPRAQPEPEAQPEPLHYASDKCKECVDAACASELEVCMGDLRCEGLTRCLAACEPNDLSCRYDCALEAPTASVESAAAALDACRRPSCGDECLGTGGLVDDIFEPSCAACIDTACADFSRECLAAAGCEEALGCAQRLDELNPESVLHCLFEVAALHTDPAGTEAFSHFQNCWTDCKDECPIGREWSCSGEFPWGRPRIDEPLTYPLSLRYGSDDHAVGVEVFVCANNEDCASTPHVVGDDGIARLELPLGKTGWEGFLSFQAAPGGPELYPQRFYAGRPLIRPENRLGTGVLRASDIALVETALGPLDEARGHIGIAAWDCLVQEAIGLRFHVDGDGEPIGYYTKGNLAIRAQEDTVTDRTGGGGFLNVEPGRRTITATLPDEGDREVARYEVTVKAGELTGLFLNPTPKP